ncbi:MAG: phenazine biosynthesis protein PhzF [Rhodocyclales bacterium]|nr:phenazine biosynthesis protein PhzF [Rhodocyclales bacterium]MDB5888823.1 phenazine biosynthesis protein PhzF [Rhodocyclales bacterium]
MKSSEKRRHRYFIADVFTRETFSGNPLAVFPDGDDLSDDDMQRIAREFNLSETAFVCGPREANSCRVRIFAPAKELPFAGHPTIGTAHVLASQGLIPLKEGVNEVTFLEGVGPVPIRIEVHDGRAVFCQFSTAILPQFGPPLSSEILAGIVGLLPEDVLDGKIGPDAVSCGVPFHFVPLERLPSLSNIQLDMSSYQMWAANSWAGSICVFVRDPVEQARIHVRVFSPSFGFYEDPATGAAAAALAGYLAARESAATGSFRWEVWQGYDMGRPSQLYIEADKADGRITGVRVGGTAVVIGEGALYL